MSIFADDVSRLCTKPSIRELSTQGQVHYRLCSCQSTLSLAVEKDERKFMFFKTTYRKADWHCTSGRTPSLNRDFPASIYKQLKYNSNRYLIKSKWWHLSKRVQSVKSLISSVAFPSGIYLSTNCILPIDGLNQAKRAASKGVMPTWRHQASITRMLVKDLIPRKKNFS